MITKSFRFFLLMLVTSIMSVGFTSCNNDDTVVANDEMSQDQLDTRAVGTKTPKLTTYIETNDVNPLNAGEYYFCNTNPQEQVIDHVILFASNIRGNATSVWLHHNNNQTYILNNRATLIAPLQAKGIKVLLGLLGDWTGVGFANLTDAMIESFAQDIADCVTDNNLDGVDFDDEYADYYNAPSGLPSPSATIYGNLVQRVKQLLPNKLVTAFRYGYATSFNATTLNALDYMWPDFGCNPSSPSGLGNDKWAKLSMRVLSNTQTSPSQSIVPSCANSYSGYGAVMFFNLRDYDCSSFMNYFASRVWGTGKTVCRTSTIYPKNY